MKRKIEPYYVITWDFNKDQIERYNIMDYLISCYKATKKSKKLKTPETFDECKKFILDKSMYMYWSRCEYECIVHCWPAKKNEYKVNKTYILVKELQNSLNLQDKEVFYMKYKNLLESINTL